MSLIASLGLDPSKFRFGARKVVNDAGEVADALDDAHDAGQRVEALLGKIFAGVSFGVFVQQITDASLAMERFESGLTVGTGSLSRAREETRWVAAEVDRLGLVLRTTLEDFSKTAAAAKGTALEGRNIRTVFQGVAEAVSALKLTDDQGSGILLAVQQIISKNKAQAEELLQIAERLPGTYQIIARGLGVTTAELAQLLESGKLTAAEFLIPFGEELHRTFGPQAEAAADGAQANFNRLRNAIFELKVAAGQELLPNSIEAVKAITSIARSDKARETLAGIGRGLGVVAKGAQAVTEHASTAAIAVSALAAAYIKLNAANIAGSLSAAAASARALVAALGPIPILLTAIGVLADFGLRQYIDGAAQEIAAVVGQGERLRTVLEEVEAAAQAGDRARLVAMRADFEARIADAELQVSQKEAELAQLRDRLAQTRAAQGNRAGADRVLIAGLDQQILDANIVRGGAFADLRRYREALDEVLSSLGKLDKKSDDAGKGVAGLGKAYEKLQAQLKSQEKANELMERYGLEAAEAAKAVEVLLSEDRGNATEQQIVELVRQLAVAESKAESVTEAIREATRAAEEKADELDRRRETGEETIATLQLQREELERLIDSYADGPAAVEAMRRQLQLEAAQHHATADAASEQRAEIIALVNDLQRLEAREAAEAARAAIEASAAESIASLEREVELLRTARAAAEARTVTTRGFQAELRIQQQLQRELAAIELQRDKALAALEPTSNSEAEFDRINRLFDEYRARIEAAIRAQAELESSGERTARSLKGAFLDALPGIGRALSDIGRMGEGAMNKIAGAAGQAVTLFNSLKDQGLAAGKSGLLAVGSALASSIFGGQGYAAEGGALGSAIGAMIPIPGGEVIGQIAGTVLGSFIKRGADQAVVTMQGEATQILENDKGLASGLVGIAEAFLAQVRQAEEIIQAELNVFDDFKLKYREGEGFSVITADYGRVDGLEDEAAVLETMLRIAFERMAEIPENVSENVRRALQSGGIDSFDEFKGVLQLARALDDLDAGLGKHAKTVRDEVRLTEQRIALGEKHNLILGDIYRLEAQRLDQLRDDVVGELQSAAGLSGSDSLNGFFDAYAGVEELSAELVTLRDARLAEVAALEEQIVAAEAQEESWRESARQGGILAGFLRGDFAAGLRSGSLEARELAQQMQGQGASSASLRERLEGLHESLEALPGAVDPEVIAQALEGAANRQITDFGSMIERWRGGEYEVAALREAQTVQYSLALAAQIGQTQQLLALSETLSAGTRGVLSRFIQDAEKILGEIASGALLPDDRRQSGRGRGGRRQFQEQFRDSLAALQRQASGLPDEVLRMSSALETLREELQEAARQGVDATTRASYQAARLQVLTQDLLAPFERAIETAGQSDFDLQVADLNRQRESALTQAMLLAEETAAASNRAVEEVFAELAGVIGDGADRLLLDVVADEVGRLAAEGDAAGVRALVDQYADLAGATEAYEDALRGVREELDASLDSYRRQEEGLTADLARVAEDFEGFRAIAEASILDPEELQAQLAEMADLEAAEVARIISAHLSQIEDAYQPQLDAARLIARFAGPLRDTRNQFALWRQGILEAGLDLEEQERRLSELAEAETFAARSLQLDFLGALQQVGVEVPGLAAAMLELERAMLLAELAALAADESFLTLMAELGTSIPELTAAINDSFDTALEGIESSVNSANFNLSLPDTSSDGDALRSWRDDVQALIAVWTDDDVSAALGQAREIQRQVEDSRQRLIDLVGGTGGAFGALFTELQTAAQAQIQQIFTDALELDVSGLAPQEVQEYFSDLVLLVEEMGLGAEALLEVELRRQEAIGELWLKTLERTKNLYDEIRDGGFSNLGSRDSLFRAQDDFRDLQAQLASDARFQQLQHLIATGGDAGQIADLQAELLSDEAFAGLLAELDSVASAYIGAGQDFAGGSDLFQRILGEVEGVLGSVLGLNGEGLEEPVEPPWVRELPTWWDPPDWLADGPLGWRQFEPVVEAPLDLAVAPPFRDTSGDRGDREPGNRGFTTDDETKELLRELISAVRDHDEHDEDRFAEDSDNRRAIAKFAREMTRKDS